MQEMVKLAKRLESANINRVYNKDALKTAFTSLQAYPNDLNEISQELDEIWTTISNLLEQVQATNRNLIKIADKLSEDIQETGYHI
tara:strand:+ start:1671 stop:1928 length:258 start_codon:yes stop_codon:yes gene_type:complete